MNFFFQVMFRVVYYLISLIVNNLLEARVACLHSLVTNKKYLERTNKIRQRTMKEM